MPWRGGDPYGTQYGYGDVAIGAQQDALEAERRRRGINRVSAPGTDYTQAQGDYERSLAGYGEAQRAADLAMLAARGEGTSVAEQQRQMGVLQAQQGQQALAASQRGTAGAAAVAARQAASTQPMLGFQGLGQAEMLRAQEMEIARGQANAAAQGMSGLADRSRQISAGGAEFLTDAELRQRAINAQREGSYIGTQMGSQRLAGSLLLGERTADIGRQERQAADNRAMLGAMLGTGGALVGQAARSNNSQNPPNPYSDERVKTAVEPMMPGLLRSIAETEKRLVALEKRKVR